VRPETDGSDDSRKAQGPRIGRPVDLRGVMVREIVYATTTDRYLTLQALAQYSGTPIRTLRSYVMDLQPAKALPCINRGSLGRRRPSLPASKPKDVSNTLRQ
jgi:hypothetical protein